MKICLSGRIFESSRKDVSLEEFVDVAKKAGYDGMSLRPWQVDQLRDPAVARAFRDALADAGLCVSSVVAEPTAELVDIARELGVKGFQAKPSPDNLALVDRNMSIGLQMHTGGPLETVPGVAQVLSEIGDKRAGIFVEPGNMLLAGTRHWPEDLFLPLRGRLVGCHYQSIEVRPDGESELCLLDGTRVKFTRVRPSKNTQIDLPRFLRALHTSGYAGFINVIDPEMPGMSIEELAVDALETFRAALATMCLA